MARLEQTVVCERMRVARERAGLTQDQLKDILKVHKHTIENVENNRLKRGPWEYVNGWAEATGVSVEWLLHGREVVNREDGGADAILEALGELGERLDRIEAQLRAPQPAPSQPRAAGGRV